MKIVRVTRTKSWLYLGLGESRPEIDRSRGLRIPETTTPSGEGWRIANEVLGDPGRNRTGLRMPDTNTHRC